MQNLVLRVPALGRHCTISIASHTQGHTVERRGQMDTGSETTDAHSCELALTGDIVCKGDKTAGSTCAGMLPQQMHPRRRHARRRAGQVDAAV